MRDGFRQSMAWLHTWSGLLLGWLLYAMFVCGTCAYFQEELTNWMQPEIGARVEPAMSAEGAARWLQANQPGASDWYITLPGRRSAATTLYWSPGPDAAPDAVTSARLDGLGQEVEARETAGGYLLYRLHFDLHYMPVLWARYLVGIAAMFMLVAIVSGVITHKKIFTDFFMLRFGKGQRSWLDAHNVSAVLTLPFVLMITYTGLVTLQSQLSPAPIAAVYASMNTYYADAFPLDSVEPANHPAPLTPLAPLLAEAAKRWDGKGTAYIHVASPGDANARITLSSDPGAQIDTRSELLTFDGVSGEVLSPGAKRGGALKTEGVMIGLHAGRFSDIPLRWLYFLSGFAGTLMVATGLILWTVKRRMRLPDPARPDLGFRIVERLNAAVIAGFPIGLAIYFLANRLLPVGLADRAEWEADSLFIGWGIAALYALVRPAYRAWVELIVFCALAFLAIPVASAIGTPRNLPSSLIAGDWSMAGIELTMIAFAGACALTAWKLHTLPLGVARTRRAGRKATTA